MNNPFFSVIIPTYNRVALLKEALLSVNQQTFKHYEILVIDDGSTDETQQMVQTLPFCVNYYKIEHYGYPGAVRNKGASYAKAPYLAFLDSDDLWFPKKLEIQYKTLTQDPTINLLHSKELWVREGRLVSQKGQTHPHSGHIFKEALNKCIIGPSTSVIKKTFFEELGGFNPNLEIAEDYEFWLRALDKNPCHYNKEELITKRDGLWPNLSTKYEEIESFRILALEELLRSPLQPAHRPLVLQELCRKITLYMAGLIKRGYLDKTREYHQKLQKNLDLWTVANK